MKKLVASTCLAGALLLAATPTQAGPIVRTQECPPGMVGRTIYVGDNIAFYGCYWLT